jgi:hypothetical protein
MRGTRARVFPRVFHRTNRLHLSKPVQIRVPGAKRIESSADLKSGKNAGSDV